jgi:hypothetical protein
MPGPPPWVVNAGPERSAIGETRPETRYETRCARKPSPFLGTCPTQRLLRVLTVASGVHDHRHIGNAGFRFCQYLLTHSACSDALVRGSTAPDGRRTAKSPASERVRVSGLAFASQRGADALTDAGSRWRKGLGVHGGAGLRVTDRAEAVVINPKTMSLCVELLATHVPVRDPAAVSDQVHGRRSPR